VWLKDLPLTSREKRYLKTRVDANVSRGRIKAAAENRRRRTEKERIIHKEQARVFQKFASDTMFCLGVALYWAEGSNKAPQFQFVNSDPEMIEFMYKWIQKYLNVQPEKIGIRIFMHKVYSQSECEEFWCKLLGRDVRSLKKTVFKSTQHTYRKNVNYRGCVRLEVGGVEKYRIMMVWKKCLKEHILHKIVL
jgi:hypothetical protein